MRINQLSPQTVNQIAAGEIIERPASVAKELVENSLGGKQLIQVQDNGSGIHKEDMTLALSRHATSKITEVSDLNIIDSMGFRGEALPSIASVSKLVLVSRQNDAAHAWKIEHHSDPKALVPDALPGGTRVEVHQLFHNLPARKKFLKTDKTEYSHLENLVKRLALAHFDVAFTLRHNSKDTLIVSAAKTPQDRDRRIASVLGAEFIENSLFLEYQSGGLSLSGWIAKPTFTRSRQDMQYFYVNSRMVRDKLLAHAVRQGYQDVLYHGRHPAYVLFLDLDPSGVDVNVHPTKHEVRFRDSRNIHDFVYHTLKRVIAEVPGVDHAVERDTANSHTAGSFFRSSPGSGSAAGNQYSAGSGTLSLSVSDQRTYSGLYAENTDEPILNKMESDTDIPPLFQKRFG